MAKVVVGADCIDIRASLLERMMLAEKSRRLPLSRVRSVNPHPPLLDMMVHWADHDSVWLGGVSSYEGHMIPSTRNPRSTLAIEVEGEDERNIYVEVDGELPENVAARISRALGSEPPPAMSVHPSFPYVTPPPSRVALEIARAHQLDEEAEDEEDERISRQRRDPLSQGSLPPPPTGETKGLLLRVDPVRRARLGRWLLGVGSLSLISGGLILADGALAGLVAVAAGVVCGALGGLVVARNQPRNG
jgi:hypothetical protein